MDNLLSLETDITLDYLIKGQASWPYLDSTIWPHTRCCVTAGNGHGKDINEHGVLMAMFQVEIVNNVFEWEKCVVRNFESFSLIGMLTVMVVKVDWKEGSHLAGQKLTPTQNLSHGHSVKRSCRDAKVQKVFFNCEVLFIGHLRKFIVQLFHSGIIFLKLVQFSVELLDVRGIKTRWSRWLLQPYELVVAITHQRAELPLPFGVRPDQSLDLIQLGL